MGKRCRIVKTRKNSLNSLNSFVFDCACYPFEIWELIMEYCLEADRRKLSVVCRYFYLIFKDYHQHHTHSIDMTSAQTCFIPEISCSVYTTERFFIFNRSSVRILSETPKILIQVDNNDPFWLDLKYQQLFFIANTSIVRLLKFKNCSNLLPFSSELCGPWGIACIYYCEGCTREDIHDAHKRAIKNRFAKTNDKTICNVLANHFEHKNSKFQQQSNNKSKFLKRVNQIENCHLFNKHKKLHR